MANNPLISVIVEGYNESLELGAAEAVVDSLKTQSFPAERVEVILVGSGRQAEEWRKVFAAEKSFFAFKTIGNDDWHYYELKNKGAEAARGEILALIDSDVVPEKTWLENIHRGIAEKGADALAGVSLFRDENNLLTSGNPILQTAASISWGFILPRREGAMPNAFLSHNLGIRSEVFARHKYRTDLGRTCAGSFLYNNLRDAEAAVVFQPEQRIAHNFTFWWWLSRLHLRFGYEVYRLRRIDNKYPNKSVAKLGFLEPLVSFFWHVLLDVPQWFRFSRVLRLGNARKLSLLPLLVCMSCLARGAEMSGMYLTIMFPERMKKRAERS